MMSAVALLAMQACKGAPELTTMRLGIGEATCSGTAVARDVVLSAAHCFVEEDDALGFQLPPPTTMLVDGYPVRIRAIVSDDNDHALVRVDFRFPAYARLSHRLPDVGKRVHYWGNPAKVQNVYREGYVTSYKHSDMIMDVNGFFGDSGAGIFNERGQVVGVVSYIDPHHAQGLIFRLMGAQALEFTPLQYAMMDVRAP